MGTKPEMQIAYIVCTMTCAQTTPLGPVWIAAVQSGLCALQVGGYYESFASRLERRGFQPGSADGLVEQAAGQVSEYLQGNRRSFDLLIAWELLADFQRQVLQATIAIPYGQTTTYARLAGQVSRPRAARAVGRAQATNPIPLIIPCHRVLGSDGLLHGYGAGEGLSTKAWLLELEGAPKPHKW
jgi:methylated-DNA-[protein]-cysteine S-methyltransferase